LFKPTS